MDASLRASFCIFAFAIVAQAQAPFPQLEQTPRRWIFELKNAPVAQGGSRRAVQDDQRAFRQAVRNAGVNFRERLAFENLFNGISMELDPADVNTLSRSFAVKAIYPLRTYSLPPTQTVSPELATALAMTGRTLCIRN